MAASDLAPQSPQAGRQAAIRAVTGTAGTYEGDWHALFDRSGLPAGTYNERLLRWINQQMGRSFGNLPEAQQAYAALNGAYNWASLSTIWTPAALGASLLGFWDADRADLITKDASNRVASWKDAVAGYEVVQSTDASKPIYGVESFNGRPGLTFDGVDDYLTLASVPFPTGSQGCEMWAVVDQVAAVADTGVRIAFAYGDANATSRRLRRDVISSTNRFVLAVGDGSVAQTAVPTPQFNGRNVIRGLITPTTIAGEINNANRSTISVVAATAITRTRIGAGSATAAANFWHGVIRFIAVTSALSVDQSTQMYAYLNRGV